MKTLWRELGRATLVGIALYAVFLLIYFWNGTQIRFNLEMGSDFAEHMIFSWVIYMANYWVFSRALQRFGPRVFRLRNLALSLGAHALVTALAIFVARLLVALAFWRIPMEEYLQMQQPGYYTTSVLIALVVAGVFYALYYYKQRQEGRVKEQKIIARTASAQFDALKNQLDPHFLFNSLNVLTSLIDEDPEAAQRFTTSLSKVYRYVLEQKNKELVPVDEEFAFARTYVRLLKMRFEDSIVFDIPEAAQQPEARIVPLSLQLLLENAVKHNVVTATRPLRITVREEDGYLVVSNNLQEKQVVKKSSGVGLQNIRQRYALLTDRQVRISKDGGAFRVALPMLTRQVGTVQPSADFLRDKRFQKAREKVEAIKKFYGNLASYCVVIPFLAWLNWRTTDFPWVVFPALGWGFGLLMHGMEAYGYNPLWGKRWEERKIRELMERDDF
ncbi:2TM domain-containing protein [Robiginitalea sp. M366]|uniref:2TM domain-containing protein n=1 Tax=Robiginitalea aestuariiviva TaxID=3036903 RepID=UPI00240E261C|nr:2TM domain-containing protein [Robiginitalea aestuariiviva]MDG1573410.1 2TM domain-containing protein [Robiginitalea aestuariiviva]